MFACKKDRLNLVKRVRIDLGLLNDCTKETMNTPVSKFGSKCVIQDDIIEKIIKLGVMETAISLTEIKESKLAKKTDASSALLTSSKNTTPFSFPFPLL